MQDVKNIQRRKVRKTHLEVIFDQKLLEIKLQDWCFSWTVP